jgi:DNA-binding MarR family transcriptional regulator
MRRQITRLLAIGNAVELHAPGVAAGAVCNGDYAPQLTPHAVHRWRILRELESGEAVSQRVLARRLGIALGLTNQLVRELVQQRYINCTRAATSRAPMRYRLTRSGRTHQAHVTRARLHALVQAYGEARERIRARLCSLAASWDGTADKRVVFYEDGSGMSELGWIYLQGTGLHLVGIVGETLGSICDIPIEPCARLRGQELGGQRFDRLVVMSFGPAEAIRARLRGCRVPRGVTFWI